MQNAIRKLNFDTNQPLAPNIEIIENAVINPYDGGKMRSEYRRAGVLYPDGKLCESAIPWRRTTMPLFQKPVMPAEEAITTLKGTYLYGGMISIHFGHFLCEATSRLWAIDHIDEKIDGIIFLPRRIKGWPRKMIAPHIPFFNELGIDADTVHAPTKPVRVEKLIVPPQGFGTDDMIGGSPEYRDYMHNHFGANIRPDGPEKLYVSRSALFSKRGSVLGEAKLEQHMEAQGYTVFHPQMHPIGVQIAHYKAAKKIVALDGSALHLAAYFASPAQKVAILNRRPGDPTAIFRAQYSSFANVTPISIDALTRCWCPGETRVPNAELHCLLEFPIVQAELIRNGFISDGKKWRSANKKVVAALVEKQEERLGTKLKEIIEFGPN